MTSRAALSLQAASCILRYQQQLALSKAQWNSKGHLCLAAQPKSEGWGSPLAMLQGRETGRKSLHAGCSILEQFVRCLPPLRGQQMRHSRVHHSAMQAKGSSHSFQYAESYAS